MKKEKVIFMNTYAIGKNYETKALTILVKNGFDLCCKNYRGSLGEIDLIVKKDELIVFVEVKFRKTKAFGSGLEAVDIKKRKKIYVTALEYLDESELYEAQYRFDTIAFDEKKYEWIKDCLWGDEIGF